MSNNAIPTNPNVLLALAEDCADGCGLIQDAVDLKQTRETDLRALLATMKGDPAATPPTLGLNYEFDSAKIATKATRSAVRAGDGQLKTFLRDARDVLKKVLGVQWSQEWALAGFTQPGSTAIPPKQDQRFAAVNALGQYLSQHPTYEVPGGGPYPEITAARAQQLHTAFSDARQAVNEADTAQSNAKTARDAGYAVVRRRLIAFVDELNLLLGPEDSRWETFGLNIPANPRAPEPASDLALSLAAAGHVLAEWTRGARSDDNRVMIQVIGTDTEYRQYAKSGNTTELTIKDQPVGATLRVKIVALNGSLEAPSGPEAEIAVG